MKLILDHLTNEMSCYINIMIWTPSGILVRISTLNRLSLGALAAKGERTVHQPPNQNQGHLLTNFQKSKRKRKQKRSRSATPVPVPLRLHYHQHHRPHLIHHPDPGQMHHLIKTKIKIDWNGAWMILFCWLVSEWVVDFVRNFISVRFWRHIVYVCMCACMHMCVRVIYEKVRYEIQTYIHNTYIYIIHTYTHT